MRYIKKCVCLLLAMSLLASFIGCGEVRSAYEILSEFSEEYGEVGTVYSPEIKEGEVGHCTQEMYNTVFGVNSECCESYAMLFLSRADYVGECSVLVAYSEYDAVLLTETCLDRLELLGSLMGAADTSALRDAFVSRYGRVVVLSALPDNSSVRAIFKKII